MLTASLWVQQQAVIQQTLAAAGSVLAAADSEINQP